MDVTALFKASVKTVRLKHNPMAIEKDKNRILSKNLSKIDEFTYKTRDICYQLTQLKNLLIDNRSAYMRFAGHLKNSKQMSDSERDIIDKESEKIITICSQFINDLKLKCQDGKLNKQLREHMGCVLDILNSYLKTVFNIYNEQKTYRIQYELDTYKLLKLKSNKKLEPITSVASTNTTSTRQKDLLDSVDKFEDDDVIHNVSNSSIDQNLNDSQSSTSTVRNRHRNKKNLESEVAVLDEDNRANRAALEAAEIIDGEDIQIFESENVQLYKELIGLSEEVEQIEKNVVDIARLQEIFTEKVAVQKSDIDRIAYTVVGATENVKDANEQINQAIQRNAGLRVYVLFFLLIMSLSLLFLDWYND